MLSRELAQTVVDKMIEIIPYNVNIMNNKGIILASGEIERVGDVHEGALEALKMGKCIEISKINDKKGSKLGVNTPISFNNRIIGVIGVTGEPKKVRDFANIVKVTAELLINREYSIQKFIIKNKIKQEFLSEWLHKRDKYDNDFIERGLDIGIDVRTSHKFMIVEIKPEFKEEFKNSLKKIDIAAYMIYVSDTRFIMIHKNDKLCSSINFIAKKYENMILRAIIDVFCGDLSHRYSKANIALSIAMKIDCKSLIIKNQEDILFLNSLSYSLENSDAKMILDKIKADGEDIFDTFIVFIGVNFDKAKSVKELHIHRNTLIYRLAKIENITSLSFDRTVDRLRFINAYLYYKVFSTKFS